MKATRITRLIPYTAAALLLLPLLAHLYLGQFNRAMADDFCFTAIVQTKGIGGALDYWFNNWTGTYSSTFFQSQIGLARLWRWVPVGLVTLWLLTAIWTLYQVASILRVRRRSLVAVIAGAVLVYAAVDGAPNVYQAVYWTSGAITYTLPLIVLTFNLGIITLGLRTTEGHRIPWPHTLLSAGLCMLAGGFSPLFAAFQVTLFGLLFTGSRLLVPLTWRRRALVMFASATFFALIALAILSISPGNAIRRSHFIFDVSYITLAVRSLAGALSFIPTSSLILAPMATLTPFVIGGALGLNYLPISSSQRIYVRRKSIRWMGLLTLVGLILIYACMLVGEVSINDLPPARAYIIPQITLALVAFGWGYLMGAGLQASFADHPSRLWRGIGWTLIMITLLVGPVFATVHTFSAAANLRIFAREWDQRDSDIMAIARQNAESEIVVTPFTYEFARRVDVVYLEPDPSRNQCVADYYRVKSIRTTH